MSLSTLSGQLSKLNEKRNNKEGLSIKGSKRHDEAAGRGINYSTQYNQTIVSSNNSEKYKASLLSKTSKSGSDVSILELLENSRSSLVKLNKLSDGLFEKYYLDDDSICGLKSHERERGLLGKEENIEVDKDIYSLLVLLSIVIQDDALNCVHVLEYLLRRYDIHMNEKTSEALLLMFSMHHYKPIYFRIMELIDLASIGTNAWLFLRPYAISGSDPPPTTVFAKKCSNDSIMLSKNLAFMKDIATLAGHRDGSMDRNVEKIVTFHGGIVHEALKIQYESKGAIEELGLRQVIRFITQFMSVGNIHLMKCSFMLIIQILQYTDKSLNSKVYHLLIETTIRAAVRKGQDLLLPEAMMIVLALITSMSLSDPSSLYPATILQPQTYKLISDHCKTLLPCLGYLWQDQRVSVVPILMAILSSAIKQLQCQSSNNNDDLKIIRYAIEVTSLSKIWESNYLPNTNNSNKAITEALSSTDEIDHNFSTACTYILLLSYTNIKQQGSKVPKEIKQNYKKCFALFQDKSPTGVNTAIIQFILEYITSNTTSSTTIHESALTELIPQTESLLVREQSSSDKNKILKQISNLLSPTVLMKHTNPFVRVQNIDKFIKQKEKIQDDNEESSSNKHFIKNKKRMLLQMFLDELDVNVATHAFKSFCTIEKTSKDDSLSMHSNNKAMITLDIALKGINKWGFFSELNNDDTSTLSAERFKACLYSIELSKVALQEQHINIDDITNKDNGLVLSLIQAIFAHTYSTTTATNDNTRKINTAAKNILLQLFKTNNNNPKQKTSEQNEFSILSVSHPTCKVIIQNCIQQLSSNNQSKDNEQQLQQNCYALYTLMKFLKSSFHIYSSTEKEQLEEEIILTPDVKLLTIQSIMSIVFYLDNTANLGSIEQQQKMPVKSFTKDDSALLLKVWEHICFSNIDYLSNYDITLSEILVKLTSLSQTDTADNNTMYHTFGKDAFYIICNSISSSLIDMKLSIMLQVCCTSQSCVSKKRILQMIQLDILPSIKGTTTKHKDCILSSIILSCFALLTNKDDEFIRKVALQILHTICSNNYLHQGKGDPIVDQLYQILLCSCNTSQTSSNIISSSAKVSEQKFLKSTLFLISYNGGIGAVTHILDLLSSASLRKLLLQRCLDYVTSTNKIIKNLFGSNSFNNGIYSTITILLSAMEQSSSFTSYECWEYFGKHVFSKYCDSSKSKQEQLDSKDIRQSSFESMFECTVRMLLNNNDNNTSKKYDEDMAKAIQLCLYLKASSSVSSSTASFNSSCVPYIYSKLLTVVFTNSYWLQNVFINYDNELKLSISMLLLLICSFDNSEIDDGDDDDDMILLLSRQAWMNLPLGLQDYTHVINTWKQISDTSVYALPSPMGTIRLNGHEQKINSTASYSSSFLVSFTFILDSIRSRMNIFFQNEDKLSSTIYATSLWELLCQLFDHLNSLTCVDTTTSPMKDNDTKEEGLLENIAYVTLFLLQTLTDMCSLIESKESIKKFLAKKIKNQKNQIKFQSFVDLLIGIIGGLSINIQNDTKESEKSPIKYKVLHSDRAKLTAISLLTSLCSQSPNTVLHALIMSMLGILPITSSVYDAGDEDNEIKMSNSSLIKDSFMLIVPSYIKYSTTTSGMSDLLAAFVWHCNTYGSSINNTEYKNLCLWFIQALLQGERSSSNNKGNNNNFGASVASYIAVLTVLEARKVNDEDSSHMDTTTEGDEENNNSFISFVFELLQLLNEDLSIRIVLYQDLLTYTERLFSMVIGNASSVTKDKSKTKFALDTSDLLTFAFHEKPTDFYQLSKIVNPKKVLSFLEYDRNYTILMWITTNLLYIVKEGLSESNIEEYILCDTQSSVHSSNIFVNMSRQFISLSVHANSNDISITKENKTIENQIKSNFLNAVCSTAKDCADFFNFNLPFSHFINCITSLIRDTDSEIAMEKYALQTLSEKAADVEAGSPEALSLLSLVHTDFGPSISIDKFFTLTATSISCNSASSIHCNRADCLLCLSTRSLFSRR